MKTTAIFNDTWAGPVLVRLQPFRTKRRGVAVTLFRWVEDVRGFSVLGSVSGSVRRMVHLAQHHPRFSSVE